MKKINVNLKNCYGIKEMDYIFDFSSDNSYSIYAPNGFMKTSFLKTFMDVKNDVLSKDMIFPERETIRTIINENSNEVKSDEVIVVESYNNAIDIDRVSNLLVNQKLKKEYESAIKEIENERNIISDKLKELSGINGRKVTPETTIIEFFGLENDEIYEFYSDIISRISAEDKYAYLSYEKLFNDGTIKFLESGEISKQLVDYIEKYHELIEESKILNKDFNHYNAVTVKDNLNKNGFFKANHTINLNNDGKKIEILDYENFNNRLNIEREKVFSNPELTKLFNKIDNKIKNKNLREFRDYLIANKEILPELVNFKKFQKKIWFAYFYEIREDLKRFNGIFKSNQEKMNNIIEKANKEKTLWNEVINIFNSRFSVPFRLKINNKENIILREEVPELEFMFKSNAKTNSVNKNELLEVLSRGEQRALYILNVLFEINIRINEEKETLVIIDDIADSFDYKNKYAIVEYLKDISDNSLFKIIFLTHNFDFHRTLSGRLGIIREKRLIANRVEGSISLEQEKYQKNPFNYWKDNLNNDSFVIACIPFIRNLAEYCGFDNEKNKLTKLLHIKKETGKIKISDLCDVYKKVLVDKKNLCLNKDNRYVIDVIYDLSEDIVTKKSEYIELEDKIILSIAIRLIAEEFMISKISNKEKVNKIEIYQTRKLFNLFVVENKSAEKAISLLEQVNLMTPENIHLNSFMYEPILDISPHHLYDLYANIKLL